MQLYQFIIIFGAATLFLAQMPSFHSLRHINLFSLILCLAYSACVAAGSIHTGQKNHQSLSDFPLYIHSFIYSNFLSGKSKNAPSKDYSIKGSQENQFFSAINAISIISTTYASGIIPEIQVCFEQLRISQTDYNILNFLISSARWLETWREFQTAQNLLFCRQLQPPQSRARCSKAYACAMLSQSVPISVLAFQVIGHLATELNHQFQPILWLMASHCCLDGFFC